MLDRLQNVFRVVFQNSQLTIIESTTANEIKMWDSLTHLELIAAVESEFKIQFSFNEVMSFKNVGDMLLLIELKLK